MEIRADELTREHLAEFSEIEAVSGLADEPIREVVWRSSRLPPFQSIHSSNIATKALSVRIKTLSHEHVGALIAKIEDLQTSL